MVLTNFIVSSKFPLKEQDIIDIQPLHLENEKIDFEKHSYNSE